MRQAWQQFKSFWTAEEIPRWFGLTLVLIYLSALGAVVHVGMSQVRQDAKYQAEQFALYGADQLARAVQEELTGRPSLEEAAKFVQQDVFSLAGHLPGHRVRLLDGQRRVLATSDPDEMGRIADDAVADQAGSGGHAAQLFRTKTAAQGGVRAVVRRSVALPVAAPDAGPESEEPSSAAEIMAGPLTIEVEITERASRFASTAGQAEIAAVVLVALGALLVSYRCVRGQLRAPVRIAERLRSHGESIEKNLSALRVSDLADHTTEAWNALIDLAQDLSEAVDRQQASDELLRVLERSSGGALAQALNALPDGLIYMPDEDHVEYVNAVAARLLGWNAGEIRASTLGELRTRGVGEKIVAVIRASFQSDGACVGRTETVDTGEAASGDQSTYRVWVLPIHRPHQRGETLVVIRDVSQQLRADRAREEFVTQVTHELRTPLTNIRAYAETLSSGMFEDPAVVTECYNVITKETRRLTRLIEDILSVSQLEVGGIELQLDEVDLRALITEGVRDVRGLADEKKIDIQLVMPSKLEPIRADRDKLAVVINNLLGNAIKYTPGGGDVLVGCQMSGSSVVLTFKDNGIGIDPSEHGRVFEKFQRSKDPQVQSQTGTGIGLYTSREIVRRHGGDIELISQKGEGSTFLVRLPHRESRATALSVASAEA